MRHIIHPKAKEVCLYVYFTPACTFRVTIRTREPPGSHIVLRGTSRYQGASSILFVDLLLARHHGIARCGLSTSPIKAL